MKIVFSLMIAAVFLPNLIHAETVNHAGRNETTTTNRRVESSSFKAWYSETLDSDLVMPSRLFYAKDPRAKDVCSKYGDGWEMIAENEIVGAMKDGLLDPSRNTAFGKRASQLQAFLVAEFTTTRYEGVNRVDVSCCDIKKDNSDDCAPSPGDERPVLCIRPRQP